MNVSIDWWFQLLVLFVIVNTIWLWMRRGRDVPEDIVRLRYVELVSLLLISVVCFCVLSFFRWMGYDDPLVFAYASFLFGVTFFFLSLLLVFKNFTWKTSLTVFGLFVSVGMLHKKLNITEFKNLFPNHLFKTSGIELTVGGFLFCLFIFLVTFTIFYYFIILYLTKQKYARIDGQLDDGLDAESLYKLSWIMPACLALVTSLASAGADIPSLTLLSGFLAGVIALSTKDLITNIAAGYYLLWSDTIKKYDVISFEDGSYGVVLKITPRCTIIKNRDDVHMIIPNTTLLSSRIENWTHEKTQVRLKLDIGVSYETVIDEAEQCLLTAAYNSGSRVLHDPPPRVLVMGAGSSAVDLQLRFWIDDAENGIRNISSIVYREILHQLRLADIEIPFDRMDITIGQRSPASSSIDDKKALPDSE